MNRPLLVILFSVILRLALVWLDASSFLQWRVEVSTPANSLLTIREGLVLFANNISPYSGSSSHIPPLILWLFAPLAQHRYLYVVPNILLDLASGLILRSLAKIVSNKSDSKATNGKQACMQGLHGMVYMIVALTGATIAGLKCIWMYKCITQSDVNGNTLGSHACIVIELHGSMHMGPCMIQTDLGGYGTM